MSRISVCSATLTGIFARVVIPKNKIHLSWEIVNWETIEEVRGAERGRVW
jgi:hypothetical protein